MNTIDNNKTINFYFHWVIFVFLMPFVLFPATLVMELLYADRSSPDFYPIVCFSVIIPLLYIRGIKYIFHFLSSKPVLILTSDSLFDYRTRRTIYWSDVEDLKIVRRAHISIKLKNAEVYISKFKNPFFRFFLRLHSKIAHGTFTISIGDLKGKNTDIYYVMEEYLHASKGRI